MTKLVFGGWDPWHEIDRFFADFASDAPQINPPLNMFYNEESVIVTSEMPGIDPAKIDLSINGNQLSIKGEVKAAENEGGTWHRRERYQGQFNRSVRLPYNVENDKVDAKYKKGILTITLPRAEADKPRNISIARA